MVKEENGYFMREPRRVADLDRTGGAEEVKDHALVFGGAVARPLVKPGPRNPNGGRRQSDNLIGQTKPNRLDGVKVGIALQPGPDGPRGLACAFVEDGCQSPVKPVKVTGRLAEVARGSENELPDAVNHRMGVTHDANALRCHEEDRCRAKATAGDRRLGASAADGVVNLKCGSGATTVAVDRQSDFGARYLVNQVLST